MTAAAFNYIAGPSLTFAFSIDVSASLTASDVVLRDLTTNTNVPSGSLSLSYSTATNTATMSFPGYANGILPDDDYSATLTAAGITDAAGTWLDGDNDGAPGGDYRLNFFSLAGDANHDGIVDITDLGILATNWQTSPRNFSQGDFNYDGQVDISDLGILATNWQKNVSPALTATQALVPTSQQRQGAASSTSKRGNDGDEGSNTALSMLPTHFGNAVVHISAPPLSISSYIGLSSDVFPTWKYRQQWPEGQSSGEAN